MGKITRAQTGKTRYQRKSPSSAALDGQYGIKAAIRVSGSGSAAAPSYADPVPPVLQVLAQAARPTLRVTLGSSKAGDSLRFEFAPVSTPQNWSVATVVTVGIEANVTAGQSAINAIMAGLASGVWAVRAYHVRGGVATDWSNIAQFTVGLPAAAISAIRLTSNVGGRPTFDVDYINDYATTSTITLEILKNGVAEATLSAVATAVNGTGALSFPVNLPSLIGGSYATRAKIGATGAWFQGPPVAVSLGNGGQPTLSNVVWFENPNRISFDYANFTVGSVVEVRVLTNTSTVLNAYPVTLTTVSGTATVNVTNAPPPGTYTPAANSPLANAGQNVLGAPFTVTNAAPAPPLVSIQAPLVGNAARLNFQLAESVPPVAGDFNPGVDSIQGQVALDNSFTTQLQDLTVTPTLAEWNTGRVAMPFAAFTGIGSAYSVFFRGRVNRPNAPSSNWSNTGEYLQDNLPPIKGALQSLITNFTPTIRVTPAVGVTDAKAVAGQPIVITLNRVGGGGAYVINGTMQAGDITGGGTGFTHDETLGVAVPSGSYTGTVRRGGGIDYPITPFSLTNGINILGEATTPSDFQGAGVQSFAFTGLSAGSASRHLVVGIHTWHFGAAFSAFKIVKNGVSTPISASINMTQGNGTFILLHIPPTLTDANGSITATGTAFTIEMTGSDFFSSGLAEMFEVTNMAPPAIGDAVFVQGSGTTAYSIAALTPAGGASLAFFRKNFAGAQAGANPVTWSGTGVIAAADASTTINEYRVAAAYRTQASNAPFVAATATAGALDQAVVVTLNGG